MNINELCDKAHETARSKGFWEDFNPVKASRVQFNHAMGNILMLIVSEAAEAQEALRKNDWDNFEEEIADVFIRLGDLCGGLGIDIESRIKEKMQKNKDRPYKHGKEF